MFEQASPILENHGFVLTLTLMQGNRSHSQGNGTSWQPPSLVSQNCCVFFQMNLRRTTILKLTSSGRVKIILAVLGKGKKRQLIPSLLPPHDKKKSYNIRQLHSVIGANYRNTFEDLQCCTMCKFGEVILRLNKCLEPLFKMPLWLCPANLAPQDHRRGLCFLHDIRMGAKSNHQGILGEQRGYFYFRGLRMHLCSLQG